MHLNPAITSRVFYFILYLSSVNILIFNDYKLMELPPGLSLICSPLNPLGGDFEEYRFSPLLGGLGD